jgi:hypothetical protein
MLRARKQKSIELGVGRRSESSLDALAHGVRSGESGARRNVAQHPSRNWSGGVKPAE